MRLLLVMLPLVLVACSKRRVSDEPPVVPAKEAAVAPEPVEVDQPVVVDLSTPEKVVYHALLAARIEDEEEAVQAYLRLVHPSVTKNEAALQQVRDVVFRRFRSQADWYVRSDSKADYVRVKRVPEVVTATVVEVEIHVRDLVHKDVAPAIVVVRRHGSEWRIVSNSM